MMTSAIKGDVDLLKCAKCDKGLSGQNKDIVCRKCGHGYHSTCTGLGRAIANALIEGKSPGITWTCTKCLEGLSPDLSVIENYEELLSSVINKMITLEGEVKSLRKAFNNRILKQPIEETSAAITTAEKQKEVIDKKDEEHNTPAPIINSSNVDNSNKIDDKNEQPKEPAASYSDALKKSPFKKNNNGQGAKGKAQGNRRKPASTIYGTGETSDALSGAPRTCWLYVGRTSRNTTKEMVMSYLERKLPQNVFSCEALESKSVLPSFKVEVPYEHKDTLLQPDFWPKNIRVRPFLLKRRPANFNQ